jgi:hypothetical protein
MSSLLTISAGILMSLALSITPCLAQDAASSADQQLKADTKELTDEQQQVADLQAQAKWFNDFTAKRLANAAAERAEVEKRLKGLEAADAANPKRNPKSTVAQEIAALKGWLSDEAAKRKQIEIAKERWQSAIENAQAKTKQTSYQIDVDKASVLHQNEINKERAEIQAENPRPAPPQIQQNTVLMPGWETETGNIPVLGKPTRAEGDGN